MSYWSSCKLPLIHVHDVRYISIPHLKDAFWKDPLTVPYLIRIDLSTATLSARSSRLKIWNDTVIIYLRHLMQHSISEPVIVITSLSNGSSHSEYAQVQFHRCTTVSRVTA